MACAKLTDFDLERSQVERTFNKAVQSGHCASLGTSHIDLFDPYSNPMK